MYTVCVCVCVEIIRSQLVSRNLSDIEGEKTKDLNVVNGLHSKSKTINVLNDQY